MDWKASGLLAHNNGASSYPGNQHSSQSYKSVKAIREGDWECQEEGCGNINFSKRTKCHRCGVPKPKTGDPLKDIPHLGGPPGLFKQGDWPCTHCGNVNWARRDKCNMCNAPKPTQKMEPRMGRGGGHFDLQDPSDRKKHDSDDEEYDEFGRKKKKKNKPNPNNMYHQANNSSDTSYISSRYVQDSYSRSHNQHQQSTSHGSHHNDDYSTHTYSRKDEDVGSNRMAFPPAPKLRAHSRSRSRPRSRSNSRPGSSSSSSSASSSSPSSNPPSSSKYSRSRVFHRHSRSRSRSNSQRNHRNRR